MFASTENMGFRSLSSIYQRFEIELLIIEMGFAGHRLFRDSVSERSASGTAAHSIAVRDAWMLVRRQHPFSLGALLSTDIFLAEALSMCSTQ